jgi:hypothetical protein
MENKPIIQPLRLIFQGSIPVENAEDAEIIYDELKTLIKTYHRDVRLNGQIYKPMEPCCDDKQKKSSQQNFPQIGVPTHGYNP